jgi:hypothetical protein
VAGERGDDGIDRRMRDEGGRMKNLAEELQ